MSREYYQIRILYGGDWELLMLVLWADVRRGGVSTGEHGVTEIR